MAPIIPWFTIFFFLNPFFISKNLLISLLCWPTYTKFTRIICIYQARKKVHGRSQSRTAVVFGCGQMSIYERPPAAGLQNFFQAWYLHILCCILTLIEKEHKSIWINGVNLILKIFFTLHLFSFFTIIFHFPHLFFFYSKAGIVPVVQSSVRGPLTKNHTVDLSLAVGRQTHSPLRDALPRLVEQLS